MAATRRARDLAASVLLPPLLLLAVLPAAFAGAGARRWGRGRVEELRADAQRAKDAAADAFYELDSAQRDLRITVETITAADDTRQAALAAADFAAFGQRVDRVSQEYIAVVDAHDLDSGALDAGAAARARQELLRVRDELTRAREELERFGRGLGPLAERAESQLAQVAPAVERARQALRAATGALDGARAAGLPADDLAAALAALGPELRLLNEGAGRHGIKPTIRRAEDVRRRAETIAAEARRLPGLAAEIDKRLSSLRTRAEAITTRAGNVDPVLSELRRRFSAACWQDLRGCPGRRPSPCGRRTRCWPARGGRARSGGSPRPRSCSRTCTRCWAAPTRRYRRPGSGCGGSTRCRSTRSARSRRPGSWSATRSGWR